MIELLSYDFMQHAILASFFAAIICAVAGTLVVVNKTVYITGGVAHASYGGIGLALFAGFSPVLGAMAVALAMGILLGVMRENNSQRIDAITSALWAVGMAFGILLSDLTEGYAVDFLSYLFGNILLLSTFDVTLTGFFAVLLVFVIVKYYRTILVTSADQAYAVTLGIKVRRVNIVLLVLLCMAVVVLMRIAGLILVMALLSIPAAIAEMYSKRLSAMMVIAGAIALVALLLGLAISTVVNISTSATVVSLLALAYLINIIKAASFVRVRG
jgi:zinc transport system permease protein